jgi:beta-1,4-mannosyl-glycoprotein beta-1,4-N-acetylglucosaminyltransferase
MILPMKTYDCFMFFDEFDVLELRLRTLDEAVDTFVLVESKYTHSGNPKPLYFSENKERFSPWLHKIRHIVIEDRLDTSDAWVRENRDRNAVARGLHDAQPEDLVFVSDCDEIWNPDRKLELLDHGSPVTRFVQYVHYYFLNSRQPNHMWRKGTGRVRFRDFKGAQWVRMDRSCMYVEDGGWHFSYAGDVEKIVYKLRSFAHTEYSTDFWADPKRISEKLATGDDLFDRGTRYDALAIDASFPKPLRDDPKRWQRLLRPLATNK